MIIKDYKEAAKMFEECDLVLRSLECYEYLQDWESILTCLSRNKDKFQESQKEALINKYVPIALNSVFRMLSHGEAEDNKGKEFEEKYMKKVHNPIEEESDYDSDSDEEDEDVKEKLEESKNKEEEKDENNPFNEEPSENKEEVVESSEPKEESKEPLKETNEEEEEIIDTETKQKQEYSEYSFISKADLMEDFEHLSNFDPEDEFLSNNKSYSIVGSVISNDEETLSNYSEFSILSDSRISNFADTNPIETDRDIYVEDIVMQKVIYYVSLFSDETKNHLQKLRSKSQLFLKDSEKFKVDDIGLEVDQIDLELVKILLDVLENYDMFRLCMIV